MKRTVRCLVILAAGASAVSCAGAQEVATVGAGPDGAVTTTAVEAAPGVSSFATQEARSALVKALEQPACGEVETSEPTDYGLPASELPGGDALPSGYHGSAERAVLARTDAELAVSPSMRSTYDLGYQLAERLNVGAPQALSDEEWNALYVVARRESMVALQSAVMSGTAERTVDGALQEGVNERASVVYQADVGSANNAVTVSTFGVLVDGREVWTIDELSYRLPESNCIFGGEETEIGGDDGLSPAPLEVLPRERDSEPAG